MQLSRLSVLAAGLAVLAGCSAGDFTDAYTDAALRPTGPTPGQIADDDIERAGEEALEGVDTSSMRVLE